MAEPRTDPGGVGAGRAFGKYQLIQELGRGGMGVVYRAWDKTLKRTVALKMLVAGDTASAEEEERLYKEATASARLSHPNILPVYEVGRIDGRLYFTMEYVRGAGFDKLMAEGKLELRRGLEILRDVARALDYAHGRGILHRDVKPGNVMISQEEHVWLMDFGLARNFRDTAKLTQTGFVMGTPNYMSPEQCKGERETLDGRSDVFGLGAVMYEYLTGRPPFDSESMVDILLAVLKSEAVPPRKIVPDLPVEVETICLKGMRKDRQDRYASAAAMADDLDRYLRGEAIHALPETTWERLVGRVRRQQRLAAIVGAAAVALGASLWFGWNALERSRKAEAERAAMAQAQEKRERAKKHLDTARASWDIAEKCLMSGRTADLPGHLADAEKALDQALEIDPAYAEALALRGRVRNLRGQRDVALGDLSQALERDPALSEARYERAKVRIATIIDMGAAQIARGKPDRSSEFKALFDETCSRAAEDLAAVAAAAGATSEWMTLHCRGARAFLEGRMDESVAVLGEAVTKNPFLDDALDLRGYLHLFGNRAAEARADFEAAIRVNPLNVNALSHRGLSLAMSGQPALAVESYQAALKINPRFVRARVNLGRAQVELGQGQTAIDTLDEALKMDARNLMALETRGSAWLQVGKPERAATDFTLVLERAPDSSMALLGRAIAHRLLGQGKEALADAEQAVKAEPESADAWVEHALAQEAVGEKAAAIADYGTAIGKDPRCAVAFANRGRLHWEAGQKQEAAADWEAFLKAAPADHPRAEEVRTALEQARAQ